MRRDEPLLTLYSPMVVTAAEELLLARRLAAAVAEGTEDARAHAERLVRSARQRFAAWGLPPELVEEIERSGVAPEHLVAPRPRGRGGDREEGACRASG